MDFFPPDFFSALLILSFDGIFPLSIFPILLGWVRFRISIFLEMLNKRTNLLVIIPSGIRSYIFKTWEINISIW